MARADTFKNRHERQSRKLGIPDASASGPSSGTPRPGSRAAVWRWVAIALAVGVFLVAARWVIQSGQSDAGKRLARARDAYGLMGTGTGFFICEDGWFITAAHVVAGARQIELVAGSEAVPARLVRVDHANDVALLKAEGRFAALPIATSDDMGLGDPVFTIGFPMPELQGQSPKLTRGDISSLAGLMDDPRHYQVSLPVQPGNSGGPLCSADGSVRGVIVSRINDRVVLESTGIIPQNINYALKSAYLVALLSPEPGVQRLRAGPQSDVATASRRVESAVAIVASFGAPPQGQ